MVVALVVDNILAACCVGAVPHSFDVDTVLVDVGSVNVVAAFVVWLLALLAAAARCWRLGALWLSLN